ncbi:MAG: radical SAM protein [Kiritimatiellae bacterium]|nr:radical SAM protein [Kiritimatiellia bacterium]
MARRRERLLLLTPPLVQTNTPYPATMHLAGYLRSQGCAVEQRDLGIRVVLDVLRAYGGDEADELLELLQSSAPAEAKIEASRIIDDLALDIRDSVDPGFGFSRYAERISAQASDFGEVEKLVKRRGVMDEFLDRRLDEAIAETRPTVIGVTCPFPGTLVAAFKIARRVKKLHPGIRLALGGGFVSTELRDMTDPRPRKYFDEFMFDEGYAPMMKLVGRRPKPVPSFVEPCYDGIDWGDYFDVVETENPMHRLWSVGRWRKLQMARGCYWHRCAFCDVKLPYINCFEQPSAAEIVDAIEHLGGDVHFVDEAMPPGLVRKVCEEIVRRRLDCGWWGNVRFDAAYTPELCRLMAKAGCIAVTGGLECANDRLLKLMVKGITLESAEKALRSFRSAGIMVHAYLMYGFPTETLDEALGALEFVRGLFRRDLIQSAFWHRFALTVHSPVYRDAEKFGIAVCEPPRPKRLFCRNEVPFTESGAPDWDEAGRALDLALYNYMEGRGLDKDVGFWLRAVRKNRHKGFKKSK